MVTQKPYLASNLSPKGCTTLQQACVHQTLRLEEPPDILKIFEEELLHLRDNTAATYDPDFILFFYSIPSRYVHDKAAPRTPFAYPGINSMVL